MAKSNHRFTEWPDTTTAGVKLVESCLYDSANTSLLNCSAVWEQPESRSPIPGSGNPQKKLSNTPPGSKETAIDTSPEARAPSQGANKYDKKVQGL